MGTRMSYWITKFYLPPDRCDAPIISPAEAGTTFIDLQMDERLGRPEPVGVNILLKDITL